MDAYERVLGDAMDGDATLFAREDYVEEAWRIVDPVLAARTPVLPVRPRPVGTRGSAAARAARRLGQSGRDQRLTRLRNDSAMQIEILADAGAVADARRAIHRRGGARGGRGARPLHVRGQRRPHAVADAARARLESVPLDKACICSRSTSAWRPPGDPDRNLTHIRESLLAHVALPAANVHAMRVEATDLAAPPRQATRRSSATFAGTPPVLDLVHLGLGPDGHTASLVPRRPGARAKTMLDVALTQPYQGHRRMTLTYPMLDRVALRAVRRDRARRRCRRSRSCAPATRRFPRAASPASARSIIADAAAAGTCAK